jgi:hypothetical protein
MVVRLYNRVGNACDNIEPFTYNELGRFVGAFGGFHYRNILFWYVERKK